MTILRAPTGLEGDDALDLDLLTAPFLPHLVGELHKRGDVLIGEVEDLDEL